MSYYRIFDKLGGEIEGSKHFGTAECKTLAVSGAEVEGTPDSTPPGIEMDRGDRLDFLSDLKEFFKWFILEILDYN